MSLPEVNLDTLHTAIKTAMETQFPDAFVEFYGRPGDKITTPGILLELEDIVVQDPDDTGTEQLPVTLNFNAFVVLDYKAGKKQAVKALAATVMAFLHGKQWSEPVSPASVVSASPDVIAGKEEAYEVMRVEFVHEAILGAGIDDTGVTPWKVYLGISPLIGPEHVDDYQLIYEGEDPNEIP